MIDVRRELENIVNRGCEKRDAIYSKIISVDKNERYNMPMWTFLMLVDIFEFFIKNNRDVTFNKILYLDSYASGHIDYDKTLISAAEKLFNNSGNDER